MSRTLRYQIASWDQITECLSNNSKNLYLSLDKYIDRNVLRAKKISVNHTNYGTLFATLIKGSGTLLSEFDQEGLPIPFMTTEEILKELERFGFLITYDLKSNLPDQTLSYLATVDNLGFDKITVITVKEVSLEGKVIWRSRVIVMKSAFNEDLLTFGCRISQATYTKKLSENVIMNVSYEGGRTWDWVTYIANIEDILEENIDPPDCYETDENLNEGVENPFCPEGFTIHQEEDDSEEG